MIMVPGAISINDFGIFTMSTDDEPDEIIAVNVIKEGKVISCLFSDGDEQKAVCDEQDHYSLENGIAVCVAKHSMGGSSAYNRAIRQGVRVYKEQERNKDALKERMRIEENHRMKHQRYLERKKKREREARIQEMAEAFKLALKETN